MVKSTQGNQSFSGQVHVFQPKRGKLKLSWCYHKGTNPKFKNPKYLLILSIILIAIALGSLGLQIGYNLFSPLILADDAAIFIMATIYIIFIIIGKSFNVCYIGTPTILIWFFGFGIRLFAMTKLKSSIMSIIEIFLSVVRTLVMFICNLFTCNQ